MAGRTCAVPRRAKPSLPRKPRPCWHAWARTRSGTCAVTRAASPANLRTRKTPVAALLMDQKIIAGVGNVYRAEVLFRRRLDPWMPGTDVTEPDARNLWRDVVSVMTDGVADGRIITTTAAVLGGQRHHGGKSCPCRAGRSGQERQLSARRGRPLRLQAARAAMPGLPHPGADRRTRGPQPVLVPVLPAAAGITGARPGRNRALWRGPAGQYRTFGPGGPAKCPTTARRQH